MKSGTSITRCSCGEVLKSGDPQQTDGEKGGRNRGDAGQRNRKYWIHATPTHNAACAIFGRFPFHAVASHASIAWTTGRHGEFRILGSNRSTAECNEIMEGFPSNKSEIQYEAFYGERWDSKIIIILTMKHIWYFCFLILYRLKFYFTYIKMSILQHRSILYRIRGSSQLHSSRASWWGEQ